MDADASFALAVWFHHAGNAALAQQYFERAQKLNPDAPNNETPERRMPLRALQCASCASRQEPGLLMSKQLDGHFRRVNDSSAVHAAKWSGGVVMQPPLRNVRTFRSGAHADATDSVVFTSTCGEGRGLPP